jgi:hypothetical protein
VQAGCPTAYRRRQRYERLIGLARYVLSRLSRRRENAKPLVYLAYSIGPEALAVGVDELCAKNDKNALEEATPLFHDRLKRIEIWCGSRKVGDIPPRQDDVSDSGAISGCA